MRQVTHILLLSLVTLATEGRQSDSLATTAARLKERVQNLTGDVKSDILEILESYGHILEDTLEMADELEARLYISLLLTVASALLVGGVLLRLLHGANLRVRKMEEKLRLAPSTAGPATELMEPESSQQNIVELRPKITITEH